MTQKIQLEKESLLALLLDHIRSDLASACRAQEETAKAATHAENRAEHAKDTRATEQSYLARGLAERVEGLQEAELRLTAMTIATKDETDQADRVVGLGALVRLREDEGRDEQILWIVPAAGGIELRSRGIPIQTLTPRAPLGKALLGLEVGDEASFASPRGPRSFEILEVA